MNLLDGVKGMLTNTVVDKAAEVLGIENKMMKSALKMFLPAIIGGVINKGATEKGAGGLLDLFKKGGYGDDNISDLPSILGDSNKREGFLESGMDILGSVLGGNKSGLLDMLLKATGINKSGGSSLMSFLAPIVINKLAGYVFKNKLNASGLSSYLNDQKGGIMSMVPGLGNVLGGSSASANLGSSTHTSSESSGGGFLKYLLPLLLLGGLAWWFMNKGGEKTEVTSTKTEMTDNKKSTTEVTKSTKVTENSDGNGKVVATPTTSSYSLNSNGDLVNASGSIAVAKGSYKLDDAGNLVGEGGRIIMPAASIGSDLLAKIKGILGMVGSAGATLEQMKAMFGDMIVKKAGAKSSYGLSQIKFNQENHKIENFSKAEVMGLAEALKSNAKGKIEVQVYTGAAENDKANNKLSETRATVIRDMLVTLGVDKGQIEAVGKGSSDAAKAKMEKVDIVIK